MGAARGAAPRCGRRGVRLVVRAALGHLPRDADARARADRLVGRVQWDAVTGGSNGLVGIWPAPWLASRTAYYYVALAFSAASIACLWRILASPFGNALRASRDSPVRAEAIGIDVRAQRWTAFMIAGTAAGLAGALFAFSKGSISPETLSVPRSVDGLVMVLLGGVQTLTGPVWERRSSPGWRTRSRARSHTGARHRGGDPAPGARLPSGHRRRLGKWRSR